MERYDLENFPISESAKNMIASVSDGFYDNSYVGKWLYEVMGQEYDTAREIAEDLINQLFPETATWGLMYHEIKWGLPVRENLSYEERRQIIYLKRDYRAPMTPYRMEGYLKTATGFDVRIADINDPGDYGFVAPHPNVFKAYFMGESTLQAKRARALLNELKQSHTTFTMNDRTEIVSDNRALEEMKLRKVIFHIAESFWYSDLLDGRKLLDGSSLLYPYMRYNLMLGFKYMLGGFETPTNADMQKVKFRTEKKTESNQILFNGSSTLAPVITSIATDFFDTYGTWDAYDSSLPKEDIAIYVSAGGSGQGTKAVIDGTATFGMVARSVKDEEKEAIKDEKEYQVGIDALTIAVNPANPVNDVLDNLTTEQIVGLFSGEYATWKDLDSSLPDEEVVVITRDINGGAHEVFQKNIMGDTEVKADAIQASSMGELVQDIIDNQYAIGYASFGVANQNEGKVTPLKVNGVAATKENILDGSYIIQRPLLLVGSGDPTDVQQAFLDYVLGDEGQKTVEDMGFIPMK